MTVCFGITGFEAGWDNATVCIGTFDGVHLGHQAVIREAVAQARSREQPCIAVTFDRHPFATLSPERCPLAIAGLGQRLRVFEGLGVSVGVVLAFDEALAHVDAEEFLAETLLDTLHCSHVVVGHDFAFGRGRRGTATWLADQLPTTIIPPVMLGGERVSSTRIRQALARGEVSLANQLLGRAFCCEGVVVTGKKLGRTIGFPTINIAATAKIQVPADGVYAGFCRVGAKTYRAAIGVGQRPTVGGENRTVEAYLIGYPGDAIYGVAVELGFLERIRDEAHFETIEQLRLAMQHDVEAAARTELPPTAFR